MFEYLPTPTKIQFELSSMCNALCLGCVRTDNDNFNRSKPAIPKKKIVSVETIVKLLTSPAMQTINTLEFCGTIDEPLMHPDFFEIIDKAYDINPNYRIVIHTNAGIRSVDEWAKLALSLQRFKTQHKVLFSIDGIGDTHEFYRQLTSYDRIIENAKSFITAGGNAVWQFLIFPWNQHQIEDASKLSEEMNFSGFITRRDRSVITNLGKEVVLKRKEANLKKANVENPSMAELLETYKPIENAKIFCENKKEGMYFVSHDSRLWPCCFIPNGFFQYPPIKVDFLKQRLYNNYGESFNDITRTSVEDIVNSPFFKNDLVESWDNTVSTGPCGKITRCAETCNVEKLKVLPIGKHKLVRGTNE